MRKFVVILMASLLSCSAASAFWPEATDSSLEIGVGYRRDNLKWKIRSDFNNSCYYNSGCNTGCDSGCSGNSDCEQIADNGLRLQSDLNWKNLNIWLIDARGKYVTCDNVYLRGNADYGWITSGKNTDSDCIGDRYDSNFESSRSSSKAKGHVYDVRFALGYQFKLCDDSFAIAPVIGYSWHGKHLNDKNLRQNFYNYEDDCVDSVYTCSRSSYDTCGYDSSSYSNCYSYGGTHSKYHARWNGPFIGFDFDYTFCCEWAFFGGYEFHWAEYHAKADWGLRQDLCDGFRQHAKNFYGNILDLGIKWDFCDCYTLALRGEFQWWNATKGRDNSKIAGVSCGDVGIDCFAKIPLRHIRSDSAAVTLDLGMVF